MTTKTITMTGCRWQIAVGETIIDMSRRNRWRGTVVKAGPRTEKEYIAKDGHTRTRSSQRVTVEIAEAVR